MSDLARVLEKHAEEVLHQWVLRVRQHLAPGGETRAQLEDHIPLFLRQLQAALRGESPRAQTSPEAGTNPVGREHGAQRFRLGFSLGALVREYGVLRDVLLDLIAGEQLQVSLEEVRLLTDFVATAIAEAVEEHARQEEKARHEERTRQGAHLAELFERVPAVVAHVSGPEHVVDLANAAFRRLVGTEEVLGRPLREFFLETHARRLFELVEQVAATAQMQSAQEVRLPGTPGRGDEDGFFELIAQPSRDAGGRLQGVFLHAQDVTAHVRARWTASRLEEDMRRSEAWLSTVLRGIGDAVIVTDAEGRAVFLNPVAEALTGWTTREARRESLSRVFPLIHEHTLAPVESPVDQVLRDGQTRGLAHHMLLVRRDGTHVPIDDSVAPLRDAQGAVSGAVLVFRDISDKRRQEKELRVFKALVEASGEYIVFVDLQGQVVYMNPAGRQLLGLSSLEQARATPMLQYVSAESQEHMAREVMPALLAGQRWTGELLHHHFLTGEAIPLAARAVPIMDEQGRLELLASIGSDTREARRQAAERERLRVQAEVERARLNALFQQAPVALGILRGSDIVIEVANPLLCQLWGRTPAQVLGLPALDALPELRGMGLDDLVRGVMATGVPFLATELQVHFSRGPGGAPVPGFFNFVYDALRNVRGTIEGVILIAVEVTEQVLARQSAQGLAREERRLRDFEQHLIGIVSHDLRNPLGAILLGLQLMMRREGLDARNTQSLVRLKSSAERAVRMVRDLLDFTQARLGGGLKMERAPVDVHALVCGVVDELLVTHPTRELRLEQRGEGRAYWDGDRVAQLLGNLVTNALKYSPADSPVTVRSTGGAEEVRLEVRNGGAPIAPEALPRLFQPLQRAVEGIDKATRSVGLGLYIVDQIARAHGGDVQVTSSAAEGTCFTVRLPRGD